MTWVTKSTSKDEAADAAQFLSRFAYVVIALAAPTSAVLYDLGIFVLFPIGVVSLVFAALLDPPARLGSRVFRSLTQPVVMIGLVMLAWALLSILWTPFSVAAGQHILKLSLWAVAVCLALTMTRGHARATDLYLFSYGLVLAMVAILVAYIASRQGAPIAFERMADGGTLIATTLFSAMGGLAARGRNGWARLLLVLAFVYVFALGSTPTMVALLVGFTALSFALSDLERTTRDLSWAAAAIIILAPLLVFVAKPLATLVMHAKLTQLPAPYPSLALSFAVVTQEKLRLITGHGFEALVRGLRTNVLPPDMPRGMLFEIWYELGLVGAMLAAAAAWFGFRAIGEASPRLAPYMTAALACNLTLGSLTLNLGDMDWVVGLAIAIISADVAARSQYRTTRPSAAHLAHF